MSTQTNVSQSSGVFGFISNLRIGSKILAGYFLLIVLMGGVVGVAFWGLSRCAEANQLALQRQTDVTDLWAMQSYILQQYINQANLIINDDPALIEAFRANVEGMDKSKEAARNAVDTPDEEQWVAEIDRLDAQTDALFFEQVVPAWKAGDEAQLKQLDDQTDVLVSQTLEKAQKLIASFHNEVVEFASAAEEAQSQTVVWMMVISIVAAVVGMVFGFFVARSIAKPVQQVTHAAVRLAEGDVNQELTLASRNELGQMAEAFRQMIGYQQQMAEAARRLAQGDVTVSLTPKSQQDTLGQAFVQMVAYQQQMAEAANRLAEGDVAAKVTPQSNKDALGKAFEQMIIYQQQMAEAANRLAEGDVAVIVAPQSAKDIQGQAFSRMIAYQQQMVEAADGLAQGDLTITITPQSEQDALSNAFAQMIANLRDLIGQVAESANAVGIASEQLATAAEQTGQASQQVAATIQQVAQGTTQQTQTVTEATNNIEQMARAADGIARGAQEQAQGVQKTSTLINDTVGIVTQVGQVSRLVIEANTKVTQAARSGVLAVQQTSQGMGTIHRRTGLAAEKVKEMGSRSKEIGRIVETIDDIADKTDMLALNAAVEAARAGEHGRGFAVVADQVRKLSEDSKEATRDITDLIERVQETVREAMGAMESTVAEVDTGTQLASETAHSLEEILQAAEKAAAMSDNIGQAVEQLRQKGEGVVTAIESVSAIVEENTSVAEEMAAGNQEVMRAMEGIASVAEENSASAEEVSASAEEMSAQVEEVVASAQEMASLAEVLREAVSRFRMEEEPVQPKPFAGQKRRPAASPAAQRPLLPVSPLRNGHK